MFVDVARLLDALRRAAWRYAIYPELLKHTVNEDGTHTISLTLSAGDVQWNPPPKVTRYEGPGWRTPPGGGGKKDE